MLAAGAPYNHNHNPELQSEIVSTIIVLMTPNPARLLVDGYVCLGYFVLGRVDGSWGRGAGSATIYQYRKAQVLASELIGLVFRILCGESNAGQHNSIPNDSTAGIVGMGYKTGPTTQSPIDRVRLSETKGAHKS